MAAAGVVVFVGGLTAISDARSLRALPDGKVLITDGPYLETKEHLGGFWVLEAATLAGCTGVGAQGCCRLSNSGGSAPVWGAARLRAGSVGGLLLQLSEGRKVNYNLPAQIGQEPTT